MKSFILILLVTFSTLIAHEKPNIIAFSPSDLDKLASQNKESHFNEQDLQKIFERRERSKNQKQLQINKLDNTHHCCLDKLFPWPKSVKLNPNAPTIVSPKGHSLTDQRCEVTGAAGTEQYLAGCNAWIQTFRKSDLSSDDVINQSLKEFFDEKFFPTVLPAVILPKVLFDPYSNRWFVFANAFFRMSEDPFLIIGFTVFVYSDGPILSESTQWGRGFILNEDPLISDEFPSPGLNKDAIFIGALNVDRINNTESTSGYVINKANLFANPTSFTIFRFNLDANNGIGNPTGVDVFDKNSTKGYFFGQAVDTFTTQLISVTINNTDTMNPTRSENMYIDIEPVSDALSNPQLGSEYLLAPRGNELPTQSHVRNGFLYYSQISGLNRSGTATPPIDRNGIRWYKIKINDPTPTLVDTGTLFSNKVNKPDFYYIPSIMTNGPQTMLLGAIQSAEDKFPNPALALRFKNDKKGTLRGPKLMTDTVDPFTFPFIGQYANMSIDPTDNMSIWSVMEFPKKFSYDFSSVPPNNNNFDSNWGLQVAKINAPPPPKCVTIKNDHLKRSDCPQVISITASIEEAKKTGSVFYDPGEGFEKRLRVSFEGDVEVLAVKYIDGRHIKVKISTKNAHWGSHAMFITNPDGQTVEIPNALKIKS